MNEPDETYDLDHNIYGEPSDYGRTFGRYAKPGSAGYNVARGIPLNRPSAEAREAKQFMNGMGFVNTTGFQIFGALLYALWPRSGGGRSR